LLRKLASGLYEVEIVETGAYRGIARGQGAGLKYAPGIIYVHVGQRGYKTLAIGTEKEGEPSVVTVRQALKLSGFPGLKDLIDGPGKLTTALQIDRDMDGKSIDGEDLWIEGDAVIPDLVRPINLKSKSPPYHMKWKPERVDEAFDELMVELGRVPTSSELEERHRRVQATTRGGRDAKIASNCTGYYRLKI